MDDKIIYCTNCGQPLNPGSHFCNNCGLAVEGQPAVSTRGKPTARTTEIKPPVKNRGKGFLVFALIFFVIMVCVAVVALAIAFYIKPASDRLNSENWGKVVEQLVTSQPLAVQGTEVPGDQGNNPLPVDPTAPVTVAEDGLSVQFLPMIVNVTGYMFAPENEGETPVLPEVGPQPGDTVLYDIFADSVNSWAEDSDDVSDMGYFDQTYFITVKKPDYMVWAFVPVDFYPSGIRFDVQVPANPQEGTFGVVCRIQNDEDYFFVELDTGYQEYMIGRYLNGNTTYFTAEGWEPTQHLNPDAIAVNTVLIECDATTISLYINGALERTVETGVTAAEGRMALYNYTWDTVSEGGFRIVFDNVVAWRPAD